MDAVLVADLWGVIKVVDAMGGIDINVPTRLYDPDYPDPILHRIVLDIPAGKQHFDGRTALAYARSRHSSSDYARMSRQQTLLLAIREDIGPKTILNAPDLFKAAKGFTWTDLPRSSLPNLVTLFGKAANAGVKHLRIVPPTYPTWLTQGGDPQDPGRDREARRRGAAAGPDADTHGRPDRRPDAHAGANRVARTVSSGRAPGASRHRSVGLESHPPRPAGGTFAPPRPGTSALEDWR